MSERRSSWAHFGRVRLHRRRTAARAQKSTATVLSRVRLLHRASAQEPQQNSETCPGTSSELSETAQVKPQQQAYKKPERAEGHECGATMFPELQGVPGRR